jgi:hypothetical protein
MVVNCDAYIPINDTFNVSVGNCWWNSRHKLICFNFPGVEQFPVRFHVSSIVPYVESESKISRHNSVKNGLELFRSSADERNVVCIGGGFQHGAEKEENQSWKEP